MNLFGKDIEKADLRDALRLGLQSAVAAAAMFATMETFDLDERFVGILSAVLVVRPSIGGTIGSAKQRFAATLVGTLIGLACLYVLPWGYGTVASLALSMMVMNFIAGLWSEWQYGVVAAVALALGAEQNAIETGQARAIAIGLGSALGVVTTLVVWPDSAKSRAERHLRRSLKAISARMGSVIEALEKDGSGDDEDARDSYHGAIHDAREAADGIRFQDASNVRERIDYAEQLYNSVLILKRLAAECQDLTNEDGEFGERIGVIRDLGCRIIDDLAGDSPSDKDHLRDLQEQLDEMRDSASSRENTSREIHRSALLFGFDEVEDCLRKLLESHDDEAEAEA